MQFKGPLTENYVLQQLRGQLEVEPRYYADKNSEIDFVVQNGLEIIPMEVKGGKRQIGAVIQKVHRRSQAETRAAFFQARLPEGRRYHQFAPVPCSKNKRFAVIA